jgi:hypothetical protein
MQQREETGKNPPLNPPLPANAHTRLQGANKLREKRTKEELTCVGHCKVGGRERGRERVRERRERERETRHPGVRPEERERQTERQTHTQRNRQTEPERDRQKGEREHRDMS